MPGPVLNPGDPILSQIPETYVSPFPSNDSQLGKFADLAGDAGASAAAQATGWQGTTRMALRAVVTSPIAGGIRADWLPKLFAEEEGIGGTFFKGIFAQATFPASTSPAALGGALAQVGFEVALNLLSAVPIGGQMLQAAVSIGKFFYALFKGQPEEQKLVVPWQEYSRDTDEDFINGLIVPKLAPSTDWTALWLPAADEAPGWKLAETDKKGNTRAYGPFTQGGDVHYVGYGAVPGTERIADITQIAQTYKGTSDRIDAVTNIGDFYPSTGQLATTMWQLVGRMGGQWMYFVRTGELEAAWSAYWSSYFGEGIEALAKMDKGNFASLALAKALGKWLTYKIGKWYVGIPDNVLGRDGNLDSYLDASIFTTGNRYRPGLRFHTPQKVVEGALTTLRGRQLGALTKSLVCAYTRPEKVQGTNLEPHAAFLDSSPATDPKYSTWGEQLTAECLRARALLLEHDAAWYVDMATAKVADPRFAEQLAQVRGKVGPPKLKTTAPPLVAGGRKPPSPEGPQGGSPFRKPEARYTPRRSKTPYVVGGLFVAAAGGYAAHRAGWF